jgi:hypothetical protein
VVTLTGTGFDNQTGSCKVSGVTFGGTAATVLGATCTPTSLQVVAPARAAGSVDVLVTTTMTGATGGTSDVNPATDRYLYSYTCPAPPTPCVASVSPTQGATTGGLSVTITGQGFDGLTGSSAGLTGVSFGAVPATSFTYVSPTQVIAVSPPGSAGTVDVHVTTTPGGSSPANPAGDHFKYAAAPPPPPNPGGSTGPTVHQITATVIYAYTPITPGIGLFVRGDVIYIIGTATLKATY